MGTIPTLKTAHFKVDGVYKATINIKNLYIDESKLPRRAAPLILDWDVVGVYPLKDRELAVTFDEGVKGTIKICKSFCTGVFKPLLDDSDITKAKVKQGAIVCGNGLDLAPDTLYKQIKFNPDNYYKIT